MMKEEKFFFNHYSLTIDNAEFFLSTLIEGIKFFYLKKKFNHVGFYFYTEMESFWDFTIGNNLTIKDIFLNLEADYQLFFTEFISKSIKIENMFENEEILNQLPMYDIVIPNDGSGEQFYLLSLNADLNGILLSFNRDIWTEYFIEVDKIENNTYTKIRLKNIANKKHAEEHINKDILSQLAMENIIYSESFKDWLLSIDSLHRDKTIEKIRFVSNENFEGGRENLIEHITTDKINNLKEIIVGSAGGMSFAQIRVFFKSLNNQHYILHGFIKQNEENQDKAYEEEIINTKTIIDIEKINGL